MDEDALNKHGFINKLHYSKQKIERIHSKYYRHQQDKDDFRDKPGYGIYYMDAKQHFSTLSGNSEVTTQEDNDEEDNEVSKDDKLKQIVSKLEKNDSEVAILLREYIKIVHNL